jgi:hypothetical protein
MWSGRYPTRGGGTLLIVRGTPRRPSAWNALVVRCQQRLEPDRIGSIPSQPDLPGSGLSRMLNAVVDQREPNNS